ncbi:hypothetical protein IJI31_00480 [bacterium]|nr:hypothetical protein [bacterium]
MSMITIPQININFGKHQAERYLYHFTSVDNYKNMLKDNKISTSKDMFLEKPGVFMVDLPNFTNQWLNNDTYWSTQNLALTLLRETSKYQDKLVCLRIPTENLDESKLRIRSQDKFFNYLKDPYHSDPPEHIKKGDDEENSEIYTKNNESIEHIYQDEIPMDNVELVGIVDIDKNQVCRLHAERGAKQKNIVIDILERLFKGQPEEKKLNYLA